MPVVGPLVGLHLSTTPPSTTTRPRRPTRLPTPSCFHALLDAGRGAGARRRTRSPSPVWPTPTTSSTRSRSAARRSSPSPDPARTRGRKAHRCAFPPAVAGRRRGSVRGQEDAWVRFSARGLPGPGRATGAAPSVEGGCGSSSRSGSGCPSTPCWACSRPRRAGARHRRRQVGAGRRTDRPQHQPDHAGAGRPSDQWTGDGARRRAVPAEPPGSWARSGGHVGEPAAATPCQRPGRVLPDGATPHAGSGSWCCRIRAAAAPGHVAGRSSCSSHDVPSAGSVDPRRVARWRLGDRSRAAPRTHVAHQLVLHQVRATATYDLERR